MNVSSRSCTIGLGYKGGRTPYPPFNTTTSRQDKEEDLKIRKKKSATRQKEWRWVGILRVGVGGCGKGKVNRDGWKVLKFRGDGGLDQPRGGLGLEWQPGGRKKVGRGVLASI